MNVILYGVQHWDMPGEGNKQNTKGGKLFFVDPNDRQSGDGIAGFIPGEMPMDYDVFSHVNPANLPCEAELSFTLRGVKNAYGKRVQAAHCTGIKPGKPLGKPAAV